MRDEPAQVLVRFVFGAYTMSRSLWNPWLEATITVLAVAWATVPLPWYVTKPCIFIAWWHPWTYHVWLESSFLKSVRPYTRLTLAAECLGVLMGGLILDLGVQLPFWIAGLLMVETSLPAKLEWQPVVPDLTPFVCLGLITRGFSWRFVSALRVWGAYLREHTQTWIGVHALGVWLSVVFLDETRVHRTSHISTLVLALGVVLGTTDHSKTSLCHVRWTGIALAQNLTPIAAGMTFATLTILTPHLTHVFGSWSARARSKCSWKAWSIRRSTAFRARTKSSSVAPSPFASTQRNASIASLSTT